MVPTFESKTLITDLYSMNPPDSRWGYYLVPPDTYPRVFRPPRATTPAVVFQTQEIPSATFQHQNFFDLAGIHCEFQFETFPITCHFVRHAKPSLLQMTAQSRM
jgi:hypothetical protein